MRSAHRILRQLGVSAVVTLTALLLLEIGARRIDLPTGSFVIPTSTNCLRRSPTLGMEFVPSCGARWSAEALTGEQSTEFHTNALGLRGPDIPDDDAVRILALGDSCTWGWEVGQSETYPEQLQRLLDDHYGVGRYRVINAGAPGYTSYQGLVYLRESGLQLHPVIIIAGYGFNDAKPGPEIATVLARQRPLLPLIRIDDFLLDHSRVWRWLRTRYGAAESVGENRPANISLAATAWAASAEEPTVRVPPAQFERNLAAIVELSRAHDAKPLLLSFAGRPRPDHAYANAIGAVGTALDVPVVVYDGPRIDMIHPTRDGYAELAAAILSRLESEGYLRRGTVERSSSARGD